MGDREGLDPDLVAGFREMIQRAPSPDLTPERGEGLKPCPTCGSTDVEVCDVTDELWKAAFQVACNNCGLRTGVGHKPNAIAAWNTRPAPSPVTDEVVAVLRAMTACAGDYLASGDATAKAIKEGIWGEKVQEARSLLAKLEVRG